MTNEKAIKYLKQLYPNGGHCWLDEQRIEAIGMAVKALQKELVSEDLEKVVEEIVDPTVLNAYGVKEIANRLRRTMIESVSEDIQKVGSLKSLEYYPEKKTTNKTSKGVFDANMPRRKAYLRGFKDGAHAHKELIANKPVSEEQVKESLISKHDNKTCKENGNSLTQEPVSIDFEQELYKAFGQVKDFTLSMRIAKWFYDMGKNSQEPVSEDLKEEMNKMFPILGHTASTKLGFYDTASHFANWQKQQMMAKAVDAVVKVDAGGYPYIPQMEIYDYEKDIPFAKEGDKYKVILIKE